MDHINAKIIGHLAGGREDSSCSTSERSYKIENISCIAVPVNEMTTHSILIGTLTNNLK